MKAATPASHTQILKSSALMGSASVAMLAIGLVRTKLLALWLGPSGVGLLGAYSAIFDVARSLAALGLPQSGVRSVADASAQRDAVALTRTSRLLRGAGLRLALIGGVGLAIAAGPVSVLSFGDAASSTAVALLGLAVSFAILGDIDLAVLQGLRRLGELSRIGVVATLLGTAGLLAGVALFGERALALGLALTPAFAAALARCAVRRTLEDEAGRDADTLRCPAPPGELLAMLRLGLAFMASALLTMGSGWLVRALVLRHWGLDGGGLYQAGWSLGGLYIGFILAAMGTDFYPRLVAVIGDPASANRLVNEQTRVGLLLAAPGVLATLVLADPLLHLLYSERFAAAAEVLTWMTVGSALRVVTSPMGYIVVASGRRGRFVALEVLWTAAHLGLASALVPLIGPTGGGLAFCGAYGLQGLALYPMVRHLTGFTWSPDNRRALALLLGLVVLAVASRARLPPAAATAVGAACLIASLLLTLRKLALLMHDEALPSALTRRLAWLDAHRRRGDRSARARGR